MAEDLGKAQRERDKAIMEELESSNKRFEIIFNNAPIAISVWGTETLQCYEMNERQAEILRRPREEIIQKGWALFTHPDDIPENQEKLKLMHDGKINEFSMEKRFFAPDGSTIWVNMIIASYGFTKEGYHLHICMMEDITEKKKIQEKLRRLGYYDQLTEIGNRRDFEEAFCRYDTPENLPLTLMIADINGLKLTNDTFGHDAGDALIRLVAEKINDKFGRIGKVDRTGGDEFAALIPRTSKNEMKKMLKDLSADIQRSKIRESIICSASFGFDTKTRSDQMLRDIYQSAEYNMYQVKLSESEKMRQDTVRAVSDRLFEKNGYEERHSKNVAKYSVMLGSALGFTTRELKNLETAALLHDIGMIGINECIVKSNDKLTPNEYEEIKKHPEKGYQLLRGTTEFAPIADFVLSHHERYDGTGYPRRIHGEEIPLEARVISISEAYDSMTDYRPYKDKKTKAEAIQEMRNESGKQFDGALVNLFIKCIGEDA